MVTKSYNFINVISNILGIIFDIYAVLEHHVGEK